MIDIISDEAFERIKLILHGVPGGAERALHGVISRATTTMKASSVKDITAIYDIKEKYVRDGRNTAIQTKTRRVDGGVIGTIQYAGNQIPLIRFGVSHKTPRPGKAVRAQQRKDRGKTAFSNAYVANLGRGMGVFERATSRRASSFQLMGVSTAQMAANSDVLEKAEAAAQETIAKRTEHEITRILQGSEGDRCHQLYCLNA